uniref:Cadherin N-terminal domain-containing protein n=1 Tax=Oryzias melastigma TaxID=30732 RepID=A0A3B3CZF3_ORYME
MMDHSRVSAMTWIFPFVPVRRVFLLLLLFRAAYGDVSFSFPEEMKRGSVIGNVAKDLGLQVAALSARRAPTLITFILHCDAWFELQQIVLTMLTCLNVLIL